MKLVEIGVELVVIVEVENFEGHGDEEEDGDVMGVERDGKRVGGKGQSWTLTRGSSEMAPAWVQVVVGGLWRKGERFTKKKVRLREREIKRGKWGDPRVQARQSLASG